MEVNLGDHLTLRDIVYNHIRDAIVSSDIAPGKRLMEIELANTLGVSRTPVREALRKLEAEGFIKILPRKGAIVKQSSPKEVRDTLLIRAHLESLAAEIAAKKMDAKSRELLRLAKEKFEETAREEDLDKMIQADIDFHDIIFQATENEKLVQILNNLKEQVYKFRAIYIRDKSYIDVIVAEHKELYAAIANSDSDKAKVIALSHIRSQEDALIKTLIDTKKGY